MEDRKITLEHVIEAAKGKLTVIAHVACNNTKDSVELAKHAANDIIYKMCSCHGNLYGVIKEILRISENLDLGSVREPLPALTEADLTIAREAAQMVKKAVSTFC